MTTPKGACETRRWIIRVTCVYVLAFTSMAGADVSAAPMRIGDCFLPSRGDRTAFYQCAASKPKHFKEIDGELVYCPTNPGFEGVAHYGKYQQCRTYRDGLVGALGITEHYQAIKVSDLLNGADGHAQKQNPSVSTGTEQTARTPAQTLVEKGDVVALAADTSTTQPKPSFLSTINAEHLMTIILFALGIIVAIPVLFSMVIITRQKTVAIIETFGKYAGKREPGISLKWPYPISTVQYRPSTRVQVIKMEWQMKTMDNLFIVFPVSVQYQVADPVKAVYELEKPERQISSYVSNTLRGEVSKREFSELYGDRTEIQQSVIATLEENMVAYGFTIRDVLVDEPVPSDEVRASFDAVISSRRQKEAAKNEAEAQRIIIVEKAKADKEAMKLSGEGLAEQREAIASGSKESIDEIVTSGLSPMEAMGLIMLTNKYDTLVEASRSNGTIIFADPGIGSEASDFRKYLNGQLIEREHGGAVIEKNDQSNPPVESFSDGEGAAKESGPGDDSGPNSERH